MDIKGLDYNTQREKLIMPEYGREIQKMVEYACELPTKEERLKCAKTIIRQMETKNPLLRENADYEQTLWDHLYLMSHRELDIDWPFDVSEADKILSKPNPMKLPNGNIKLRHYGHLVEELFEQLKTMPEGEERDALVSKTANQMKRDLATWGHGSMDDERVASDLARFTDGVIQLDLNNFVFEKLNNNDKKQSGKKKK
ncbi:MAG: DUF4290 domain-containing protein [Prevotella sp.]|jgi:hypothetical protein|nr:DUF4290 domain-containing protein [Prevotella sp.]MEE3446255.1 DUF4290 domain-containing protein [Prevotella sp.]